MINVGVITLLYNNYNYGGILQAYALIQYLNNNGFCAKGILYNGNRNVVYSNTKEKISQYGIFDIVKKGTAVVQHRLYYNSIASIINERKNMFIDFIRKYIPTTEVYSDSNISLLNSQFDYFVSGSDQVWNPNCALYPFVQGFVDDNRKKVSYAASISRSLLSEHEKKILFQYLEAFSYISVREKTAAKLLSEMGIDNVETVIDPTFLLEKKQWELIIRRDIIPHEKYVICYFFSNSLKIRKKISTYCKNNKLKMLFIPYSKQEYSKSDSIGDGMRMVSVGPIEFLSLIYGAECVFTDSFHGVALSINLNKQFFAFKRDKSEKKASMNSRVFDLLSSFKLDEYLIDDIDSIENIKGKMINYDQINLRIRKERAKALVYLKKALQSENTKNAKRSEELHDCVSSKLPIKFFAGQSVKYAKVSSSGGVFSAIAEEVIKNNGIVYGVGYNKSFDVVYKRIDNIDDVPLISGSKYVQSRFADDVSLHDIVADLKNGVLVLFSGTACMINALYSYLQRQDANTDHLLTIEVICHGVPSQGVWKSYREFLERKYKAKMVKVNFRDKTKGWRRYSFSAEFENGVKTVESKDLNEYMQLFLSDYSLMNKCRVCKFKCNSRISDITLGDLWGIEISNTRFDENKGLSLIVINSDKGCKTLNSITQNLELLELKPYQESIALTNMMQVAKQINDDRLYRFNSILKEQGFKNAYLYFKKNEWKYILLCRIKGTLKRFM